MFRLALAGALALASLTHAFARNTGEWNDASPELRQWFKSVRSPNGVPCCDVSDGHLTEWRKTEEHYEVPINQRWEKVPPEAVVRNSGNPIGKAIVWYVINNDAPGGLHIRCFVPASEI